MIWLSIIYFVVFIIFYVLLGYGLFRKGNKNEQWKTEIKLVFQNIRIEKVLKMKIIGKSNFDDGSVLDILIYDNVCEFYGRYIIDFLNSSYRQDSIYCYELVPDDYKLYSFKP